jgi:beta-lactamase class A
MERDGRAESHRFENTEALNGVVSRAEYLLQFGRLFVCCDKVLRRLLVCALFVNATAYAQNAKLDAAEKSVLARVEKSGAEVGIAFRMLNENDEWYSRADESFHAASTMKVPVLIELFHQVKEGKLKLGDTLVVKNEFHSIVDGSPYSLDAEDDSETDLYKAEGQKRSLAQLAELMITVSSNFATNLLIEKLSVENIRTTVHSLGADGMNVLRGVEDGKAFEKGLNNTTTARGLAILLTAIGEGKAVDSESSEQMAAILKRQKFNEAIPAGLPAGMPVAHKTGDITKIHHDAAIVYAKRPFVLVILVRGIAEDKEAYRLMADITRDLYNATN